MDNFPCKGSDCGFAYEEFCGGRRVKIPRLVLPFVVVDYLESAQKQKLPNSPIHQGNPLILCTLHQLRL
jgi:hypothetical protein